MSDEQDKWINPEWPKRKDSKGGFFELPDGWKIEGPSEEEIDSDMGHLYLWKKQIYVRGCDEDILGMLDADESNPLIGNQEGLSVNEIRKRYKERTKP